MFSQPTLQKYACTRFHQDTSKRKRCAHGYLNPGASCVGCYPHLVCKCGSGIHKHSCCYGLELFKKRLQRVKQNSESLTADPPKAAKSPKAAEPPHLPKAAESPHPPKAAEPPEPPKKMRKVVIGGVEMQVEEGSTMTIGGVSVVLK